MEEPKTKIYTTSDSTKNIDKETFVITTLTKADLYLI